MKPTLEAKRLIIRPIMPEDVRAWLETINHKNLDSYEYGFCGKVKWLSYWKRHL